MVTLRTCLMAFLSSSSTVQAKWPLVIMCVIRKIEILRKFPFEQKKAFFSFIRISKYTQPFLLKSRIYKSTKIIQIRTLVEKIFYFGSVHTICSSNPHSIKYGFGISDYCRFYDSGVCYADIQSQANQLS